MNASARSRKREEQDLICRVEGDAPLGAMMRRYWLPALLSSEVAERDGTPVRVRMLGQNMVAFRDSHGVLGLVDEACPHRRASLGLGRNEEGGIRCIYHGWKFDVRGTCVEMPTEPGDFGFADRLRLGAYVVREAGGIVWAYLGPRELEPAFPAFDWTSQPREQIALLKFVQNTNYLQAAEGSIDSAHTRFLHRGTVEGNEEKTRNALTTDLAPRLEAADTCYGFRYVAIRRPNENPDTMKTVKMTRYVFPTTAVTSRPIERGNAALSQIFVPIDDTHTMHYSIWHQLDGRPIDERAQLERYHMVPGVHQDAGYRPYATLENWYRQDRDAMKRGSWTGIDSLMIQDAACQETMGPIADHSLERLGTSDVAIIRLRKRMLESVRRFMAGEAPIGLDVPYAYANLTHIEQVPIPIDEPWQSIQTFDGEFVQREMAGAR
jgi:phthalate 4,5-dioxygenase oxygenase subunit